MTILRALDDGNEAHAPEPVWRMNAEEAALLSMLRELHDTRVAAYVLPVRAQITAALRRMAADRGLPPDRFDRCELDFESGLIRLPEEPSPDDEQRGL